MIDSAVSTDLFDSELKRKRFVNKNKWWWTI